MEFGGTQFGQSHFPVLIYSWSRGAAGGTQRPLRGLALGPRETPHPCSQSPTVKHRRAGVPGWCSDPGCPRPKSRRGQWGAAGSSGETAFWTLPPGCCGQLRVTAGFWSCLLPSATGPHQLQAGPARPAATGLEGEDLPCSSMRMRAARAHLITRDPLSTPRLIPPNTGRPFPCWCASLQSQGFSSHVGARPSNHRETLPTLVCVPPITGRLFPRWCASLQSQGDSSHVGARPSNHRETLPTLVRVPPITGSLPTLVHVPPITGKLPHASDTCTGWGLGQESGAGLPELQD